MMKNIWLICTLTCFLYGCSSKVPSEVLDEIVILEASSYRYDLNKETYTVFNYNKPDYETKFTLSDEDKTRIKKMYFKLGLNELNEIDPETGNIFIKDECTDMPKTFVKVMVKTKERAQEIQINYACDNFYLSNFIAAKRVKKFIAFVMDILRSKPEIKNAPESDIFYL